MDALVHGPVSLAKSNALAPARFRKRDGLGRLPAHDPTKVRPTNLKGRSAGTNAFPSNFHHFGLPCDARRGAVSRTGHWTWLEDFVKGKRTAIFRNAQWEVTKSGIASRRTHAPYCFLIDAELLLATETFGAQQLYDWPP